MQHTGRTTSETLSRDLERGPRHALVEPFLFLAFHADAPAMPYSRHGLGNVDEIQLRRGRRRETVRLEEGTRRTLVLTIPDRCLSGMHARIRKQGSEFLLEDGGSKNGSWVNGRRVKSSALSPEALIEVGNTFLLFKGAVPIPRDGERDRTIEHGTSEGLETLSPALGRTYGLLTEVATSTIPVLVTGETGCGKEVLSTALHRISRRAGPFVPVNCGAVPVNLAESELFGFRRGAFSGAVEDRTGFVRAADGGTLFLDEIADLPLPAQTTLLRVLSDGKVTPIGSVAPIQVDFRLVSATHRCLEELSTQKLFREDLLARLKGFCVALPPLRERKEDIGLLAAQMLSTKVGSMSFTPEAVRALFAHSWPENVRELARRLSLATVLAKDGCIKHEHLFGDRDASLPGQRPVTQPPSSRSSVAPLEPEDVARRDQIVALLKEHQGNVTAVANAMGKARAQVQRWMRRYGVHRRTSTSS
jgi:DNA-binding NtrC family response regulator